MTEKLIELTARIVAGYVGGNTVSSADLPALIVSTYTALNNVDAPLAVSEELAAKVTSAQIRKSIRPDVLISFIDQKPYKMLRRHLSLRGMTPADYREKFGLPKDYPMVARSYSEQRSMLAKSLGLGQNTGRKKTAAK